MQVQDGSWSSTAETVKVPQMAESITEGTLKTWSKQVGDSVAADEEVATIETDKVSTTKIDKVTKSCTGPRNYSWTAITDASFLARGVLLEDLPD
jgi:hypothetical protein